MDCPLIYFDLETATSTGAPHLLEIGAVRVVDGEAVDTFQSLVLPQVPISEDTTEIHGLTEADVRSAPFAAEILPEFTDWVGDDWLVAHDIRRDAETLGFEYARAQLSPPAAPLLCTLKLARAAFPEAHDHKLATLGDHLDLEEGRRHRALDDATLCWQIAEACIEKLNLETGPSLLAACGTRSHAASLATATPSTPRTKTRWRPLEDAVASGDSRAVEILYGESVLGSHARLPVVPRLLYRRGDGDYLEAECARTGILKTYSLDRVLRVQEHA